MPVSHVAGPGHDLRVEQASFSGSQRGCRGGGRAVRSAGVWGSHSWNPGLDCRMQWLSLASLGVRLASLRFGSIPPGGWRSGHWELVRDFHYLSLWEGGCMEPEAGELILSQYTDPHPSLSAQAPAPSSSQALGGFALRCHVLADVLRAGRCMCTCL